MENIVCNLCAGSPDVDLYTIYRTDEQRLNSGQRSNVIRVDICIGKEIQSMINNGISTINCCCGHGVENPTCLVGKGCEVLLDKYGYKYNNFDNNLLIVDLKTNVQCELRKVIGGKVWKYLYRRDENE